MLGLWRRRKGEPRRDGPATRPVPGMVTLTLLGDGPVGMRVPDGSGLRHQLVVGEYHGSSFFTVCGTDGTTVTVSRRRLVGLTFVPDREVEPEAASGLVRDAILRSLAALEGVVRGEENPAEAAGDAQRMLVNALRGHKVYEWTHHPSRSFE